MADQQHLDLLKQGKDAWNAWRKTPTVGYPVQPDLSSAKLHNANLMSFDLSNVNLEGADLSRSFLDNANLVNSNLRGADLSSSFLGDTDLGFADLSYAKLINVRLDNADLGYANLFWADLSYADLNGADLSNANLRWANLSRANLSNTNFTHADLSEANLGSATLVETNLVEAILTNCYIYGISAWNVRLEGAKQDSLIITPPGEPTIKVDDIEVAQFIYLLLNHQKLRNVLNAVTERGVLLLGRFGGGGLEVLQAVAARLREAQYLPIIFDFDRPQDRNYTETVKTLAGLSRFIIADLSGPSVPQELYATVPHFKIPFVPILEAGRKQFAMAVDLLEYPWVIRPPVIFASTDELVSLVPTKIIAPAEEKHQARQQLLNKLFHDA